MCVYIYTLYISIIYNIYTHYIYVSYYILLIEGPQEDRKEYRIYSSERQRTLWNLKAVAKAKLEEKQAVLRLAS